MIGAKHSWGKVHEYLYSRYFITSLIFVFAFQDLETGVFRVFFLKYFLFSTFLNKRYNMDDLSS